MPYPLFLTRLLIRTGLARFVPALRRLTGDGPACLHHYSDRVLAAPHDELRLAAHFLEMTEPDGIDLALAAPRFELAPSTTTHLPPDRRGYPPPWGLPELRETIAARLHAEHRLTVHPGEQVLITHGAAGAFSTAVDAFVNPGSRVVLFDPTSPFFALALGQRRARVRWVPTWVEGTRVRFGIHRLARALQRARLLVLADPANPTGAVHGAEDLELIAWWAAHHDALVLVDEAFARYRYEGERLPLGTLARLAPRLLLTGSVSKGHGLASARVGWLSGPRALVRASAVTQQLQTPGVPTLCQQLALAALRQDDGAFRPILAEFDSRRRYVRERLTALGLKPVWPAGGFFFWVPVQELKVTGTEFATQLLRTRKVLVSPGEMFGPGGGGYVRISYATEGGRLREGLSRLAEFVRQLQGRSGRAAA